MKTRKVLLAALTLPIRLALDAGASAAQKGEDKTARRLLEAAEGLQMPSSESDSVWSYVSYPGEEELPGPERFQELSICPAGPAKLGRASRFDFDATLDSLGRIEPWMDAGQKKSARGFRKLRRLFHSEFGNEVDVYRCETGGPKVYVYFVGTDEERLAGLLTVSIET